MEIADYLVSTGLAAAGYNSLNIDDCWAYDRFPNGTVQADPTNFPDGMAALGQYIHSKGLKYGIYSDAGFYTCQRRPGGLFYEDIDAQTYASWGVDYLKYDNCYSGSVMFQWRYNRMRDALNATGHPIYFSLCEWGQDDPWLWANNTGNSWRTTGDINDSWERVVQIIQAMIPITQYGGIGGWNDPDMLEVGNGGMTYIEYQTHFAMWAYMKAPLIIGCDVRSMSNETTTILMNSEIIAVNHDPLGKSVNQVWTDSTSTYSVWAGPLVNGTAVALLNIGENPMNITAQFSQVGVSGSVVVRDLYLQQDLGTFSGSFTGLVQPHGIRALVFYPVSDIEI
jgi:alpha-galactosidase